MLKISTPILVIVCCLFFTLDQASANLDIVITDNGSGGTNWAFSGSMAALGTPAVFNPVPGPPPRIFGPGAVLWNKVGLEFTERSETAPAPGTGDAQLINETQSDFTLSISDVFALKGLSGAPDRIGFQIPSDFPVVLGDTITLNGSLDVPTIAISDLSTGGIPLLEIDLINENLNATFDGPVLPNLDLTIGAIPEPSAFYCLGIFAAVGFPVRLLWSRMRRRGQQ